MSSPPGNLTPTPAPVGTPPGARHFRRRPEALRRFWKDRPSRHGLLFLLFAFLAAVLAPLLVGTRPIVCKYKQEIHFPFLSAYTGGADRGVFLKDGFGGVYPANLRQNDAQSWAVWPLFYKDPLRRIEPDEWEGDPGDGARKPPSLRNWFGTDEMGRDVFARVLYGTRTAFLVGLVSMAIAGALGIPVGALAGYAGGKVDLVISRVIEVLMSIPTIILLLALLSVIDRPGLLHLMAAIGLTRWDGIARYTRAEVLRVKELDFVLAARALGTSTFGIVFRHILPNALAPALVALTFGVANAVLLESALSFLGFGSAPGDPSWGRLLDGWRERKECWWLAVFPGLAIVATVLCYNLVGDGVREATDPRRRG